MLCFSMLEDYAQGLDLRDPTFDSPLKKVARVLHLTDGKIFHALVA